jgi:hypothetical protein
MSAEITLIRTVITDNNSTWYSLLCNNEAEYWVRNQDKTCWNSSHILSNILDVNSELMSFIKLKCPTE